MDMVSTIVDELLLFFFFSPILDQVGNFMILNHRGYQYLKSKPINYQFHSQNNIYHYQFTQVIFG
jgi:hypothetical protein